MNLRELSEMLKLSQTTVSRALGGYPEVKEATRQRVLEAARKHNYHPNAKAQSLATGRSMSIGHVIPALLHMEMTNVIFSEFIAGAGEVYAAHGYDMVVSIVADQDEMKAYRDMAARRRVDGIIVHGPIRNDPRIALLRELELPFVVHGRSTGVDESYSWLDVNNRRAIERATRYLLDLGHRRIGLVNGQERMDFALRRREGYLAALDAFDVTPDSEIMTSGDMTEPYGFASASQMLTLDDPPTAFVCSSIVPTLGIRRAIEGQGLQVGRDISIVSFDDVIGSLPNGTPQEPTYTATRSSVRAAGRRLAEMLMLRIENPLAPEETVLWEAEMLLGQSTGVRVDRSV